MDQISARDLARKLTKAGIPAVADNRGGWSGQPASQVWGVRPAEADGLTGNYEKFSELPGRWRVLLGASEVLDLAVAAEARHREFCRRSAPRGACMALVRGAEQTDAYLKWLKEHPEMD